MNDVPVALANLAQLARLDLEQLLSAVRAPNAGLREAILERANERLREVFREAWGQAPMTVRIALRGTVLEVLVSIPGGGYNEFHERSAGLRSFVALRAFLEHNDASVPPILLVDEAETHLHYDAQADLVDLFTEQRLAAKVIYTTHSAGCLPRDLGNGIRVVAPTAGSERSTVKKSVWEGSDAGFTPLIFGMGATTFAFLPARNVVLTEGITDAMLLPTLFREATGRRNLPFQVAPGLSAVAPARMFGLTSEGGSVLFLTDGDDAGKEFRKQLRSAHIPETHVFGLDLEFSEDLQVEDLIDPSLYAAAVNEVLRDFQPATAEFTTSDIPSARRISALKSWCKTQGLKPPDKVYAAQRLLNEKSRQAREGNEIALIDAGRRDGVAALCEKLIAIFPASYPFTGGR